MNVSEVFIRRPIATTLLMAGIFIFGLRRLRAVAGRGAAQRRVSNDRGDSAIPRRQPTGHG